MVKLLDPYIPTSKEIMARMLVDLKEGDVFIDLGSGDARFIAEAYKKGADAYGVELDPELVRKSQLWLNKNWVKGKIYCDDLINHNLSSYNYITAFFRDENQTPILEKIKSECKKGTIVYLHGSNLVKHVI